MDGGHRETWTLSHPQLSSPVTLDLIAQRRTTPMAVLQFNNRTLRMKPAVTKDSVHLLFLHEPYYPLPDDLANITDFTPSSQMGVRFVDDNTVEVKAITSDQPIVSYHASLEGGEKLLQNASWNIPVLNNWKVYQFSSVHLLWNRNAMKTYF